MFLKSYSGILLKTSLFIFTFRLSVLRSATIEFSGVAAAPVSFAPEHGIKSKTPAITANDVKIFEICSQYSANYDSFKNAVNILCKNFNDTNKIKCIFSSDEILPQISDERNT